MAAADAAAVAEIYNAGIRGRLATFDTNERSPDDVLAFLSAPWPYLVAEQGGAVVGWVGAGAYRHRACYNGVGDFSIYVAPTTQRQGVGDALMAAFLAAVEARGGWKVVGRIFPENAASLRLAARHGFREVGVYRRHAQLDGAWRDVVIVERLLGPALG